MAVKNLIIMLIWTNITENEKLKLLVIDKFHNSKWTENVKKIQVTEWLEICKYELSA